MNRKKYHLSKMMQLPTFQELLPPPTGTVSMHVMPVTPAIPDFRCISEHAQLSFTTYLIMYNVESILCDTHPV